MFQSRVPVPSVPASCSSVLVHRSCPVFRHVSGLRSDSQISVSLFTVVPTPCVFPGLVFLVSLPPSVLQYSPYTSNLTLHVKSLYISSVFGRNSNARPCRTPVRTLQKNPPASMTSAEWRELADLTEANQEQLLVCTNAASRLTDQLEQLTRLLSHGGRGADPTSSQTHDDWRTCLFDRLYASSGPRAEPTSPVQTNGISATEQLSVPFQEALQGSRGENQNYTEYSISSPASLFPGPYSPESPPSPDRKTERQFFPSTKSFQVRSWSPVEKTSSPRLSRPLSQEFSPDYRSNSGSSRTPTPPGQQVPYSPVDSEPAQARNLVSCAGLEEQCVRQGIIRLSNGRVTEEERRRRFLQRLCFYCGAADHVQVSCPVRPPRGSQRTDLLVSDVSLHTSSRVPVPSVPASCSSVLVHRSCPVFRHVSGLRSDSQISVSLFTVVPTPCVFPGLVFLVSLPPSVLQYSPYTSNLTLHVKSLYISSVFGRNSNARPCRTPVRTLQLHYFTLILLIN
uniref:CCHC-type domain-containing protein n=1 Tax=Scleropages formosus TaxID=113540 RepID=A0A8D0CC55_SCLFO